jgi:YD repeat-containing protein
MRRLILPLLIAALATTAHAQTWKTPRNGFGQPVTTTHPDGLVETNTYDSVGRLLTKTLAAPGQLSRTTTYTRDTNGRVTRTTYPDSSYEDYTYSTFGLLTTVRETNGSFTKHTYDTTSGSPTAGLRLSITRGLATATATTGGETTTFSYYGISDPSGSPARLLASETDPRGRTTSYQYDHAGRLLKTTYPDGSFRQLVLDEFGNKTNEFDGTSLEAWTYDDFRRPLTHTDALGGVTTYDYGLNGTACSCYGAGAPTLITSPAGRKTRSIYDLKSRLIQQIQGYLTAEAASTTHTRDSLGRITSTTDPDGIITTYTYDSKGRTLSTTLAPFGLNLTTSSTYSAFGDTLSTTASGGRTTTMAYDKMSRTVSITDPLST